MPLTDETRLAARTALADAVAAASREAGAAFQRRRHGDGLRLDLLRVAGADTARVIAFCNDNEGGEMSRSALKAVLEAFPQAAIMVRAVATL